MDNIDITPQGQKLLVKVLQAQEEELDSGIVIPGTANADLKKGEVIKISPELNGKIKEGDIVLYPSKKGIAQVINKEPYLWLDATPEKEEIWGIITKQ